MSYVTHAQLAERPGARELAQVASDEHQPLVPYELMEQTLQAADRSAWTPEQIALADQALQRVDDAVADADGLIDGFLRQRGYPLPLSPVHRLVTVWSRAISRYNLHKHRRTLESDDTIVRDYRDALKLLQQVADGKLSLGAADELAESGVGKPLIKRGCTPVRDALRDY
jgi:phage gp36-like protein